jgi:catechol 2,3-dioxygenase-like lactoylglutathione lyase family enzyme
MHQQGERAFVHRIFASWLRNRRQPYRPGLAVQNIFDFVSAAGTARCLPRTVWRYASAMIRSTMRAKLVPEFVCSNFAESHRFYTELLGFRVLYSRPEERFAYLERDGAELMLEQSVGKDRLWPRAELAYPFGRGINFQIQVADAERLHNAILVAGVAVYLPLEERWYRRESDEIGVKQFAIQDPDGYLLRFSQVIGER